MMSTSNITIEQIILRNLLTNEEYMRRVLPFIQPEYFEGINSALFKEVCKYVAKYNKIPTDESFKIELDDTDSLTDEQYRNAVESIPVIFQKDDSDHEWLMEKTEKWCQDRAVFNAIMESISIIDGKHQTLTKNSLPELLSKALGVSFDANVGHDFIEDFESRFDFYHAEEERLPFDLSYFNKITKNGLPKKSLTVALAGTGVGKSLFMCHMAGANLSAGKNVLYLTMEMSEERVAERVDANLLDTNISQLPSLSKSKFSEKVKNLAKNTTGKFIIKEYPTGSAHAGHFRALLNELKLKKKFVPDIIFIDYLNICASSRVKMGGSTNSYTYIKSIAEELRGLAVEFDVPVVTATQTTRGGFGNSDVGLEDTAESFGLPATADLMFALVATEELEAMGQIMVKQLKNRYNDVNLHKRFVIGIDRAKMRLMDASDSASDELVKDAITMDNNELNEKFKQFKM